MSLPAFAKSGLCLLGALLLIPAPARALLNVDGTRNQLFVFGNVTFGYDSNIFADATDRGDYTVMGSVGAQMKRHAGIIAVDASATLSYTRYGRYSGQDALNPNFIIEFNKTVGRTTGAFTISAYRESRADSSVNLRTTSWNFPVGLNLKYPVNDKYYFTSQTSYLNRRYVDSTSLANLKDYSEAIDLFYVYTSRLDLLAGYRIRVSQTSLGNDTVDHWFSIGATGGLFAKLNGTLRFGYQIRDIRGNSSGNSDGRFSNFNALAALGWPVTRKLNLTGSLSRDFTTIATGVSVDVINATLRANYTFSHQLEFLAGLGGGRNSFVATLPPRRLDTFFSYDFGARYKMNEHLQVEGTYTYLHNWSTLQFSEFVRHAVSINISSRF